MVRHRQLNTAKLRVTVEDRVDSMRGRRVLIVEDEYLLAADLSRYFREMGALVLGPAGSLAAAQKEVSMADAAVLDIDLNGDYVFPIADQLASRGVPFVFCTGLGDVTIPERFGDVAFLQKPARWHAIFAALFPDKNIAAERLFGKTEDVISMLPKLRLSARLMMGDPEAADRLVETTLEAAIEQVRTRSIDNLEGWLSELLEETYLRRFGFDLLQ
jgi:ActR/RegA family two-component response regulator